ncbi:hypothetical protein CLOM_g19756 [Closterium sp. NIES-68]|nr:hypothetical protein CLOM_g19756 [Closterium sp. NIES-68]
MAQISSHSFFQLASLSSRERITLPLASPDTLSPLLLHAFALSTGFTDGAAASATSTAAAAAGVTLVSVTADAVRATGTTGDTRTTATGVTTEDGATGAAAAFPPNRPIPSLLTSDESVI